MLATACEVFGSLKCGRFQLYELCRIVRRALAPEGAFP
jgi:hypothetical protein